MISLTCLNSLVLILDVVFNPTICPSSVIPTGQSTNMGASVRARDPNNTYVTINVYPFFSQTSIIARNLIIFVLEYFKHFFLILCY